MIELLTLLCLWMKLTLSISAEATATKNNATKIDFILFTDYLTFHWIFFQLYVGFLREYYVL